MEFLPRLSKKRFLQLISISEELINDIEHNKDMSTYTVVFETDVKYPFDTSNRYYIDEFTFSKDMISIKFHMLNINNFNTAQWKTDGTARFRPVKEQYMNLLLLYVT